MYRQHQAFREATREVELHIIWTLMRCLASENCKQADKGDDDYKGVETNIVLNYPDRGSSGSEPINQCHVHISSSPLYEGEVFMYNTEILCNPRSAQGQTANESARLKQSIKFSSVARASATNSWMLSLNNTANLLGSTLLVIFPNMNLLVRFPNHSCTNPSKLHSRFVSTRHVLPIQG